MSNSSRLQILFDKYLDNRCTSGELREFWESVSTLAEKGILDQQLDTLWTKAGNQKSSYTKTEKEKVFIRILQKGKQVVYKPTPKKHLIRIAAAAAIFLFLAGNAFYLWDTIFSIKKMSLAQQYPEADLPPGDNRAILTLADGSSIILDSVQKGNIAKQENTDIIKLENGKVVYRSNNHKPPTNSLSASEEESSLKMNILSIPRGGEYQLTLSDGTKVWLNAASSITFPTIFTGEKRKIEIKGEAYFEVAKNEKMPFIVNINNKAEVKVLGTHFNINAYEDENMIRTTLLEGRISISSSLRPFVSKKLCSGEQASVNKHGELNVTKVNVNEVIAWKEGLFSFCSADIRTVMRQLSRWYDVDIVCKGDVIQHFNGTVPRNISMMTLFEALTMTGIVHFEIKGKEIIVKPN